MKVGAPYGNKNAENHTMPHDKTKIYEIKDFAFGESIFHKENQFKSEKAFNESAINVFPSLIKYMYDLDCIDFKSEEVIHLKRYGLLNVRCDFYVTTKQGIDVIIECKNPTHDKSETFNAIGQMIAYKINLDAMPINYKLILATSLFDINVLKAIKRYNLDFDMILHNKVTSAFLLANEL